MLARRCAAAAAVAKLPQLPGAKHVAMAPGPCAAQRRSLAKKAAAAKGRPQPEGSGSSADLSQVVTGLNILRDGSDPVIQPDSEYPDWVWTLYAILALPCCTR